MSKTKERKKKEKRYKLVLGYVWFKRGGEKRDFNEGEGGEKFN